ncbi:MAG: glycosyltransferase family 4 protein [Deltaproteobacteria bacterium]|nr:glycosyltransferase family 4 protein [Deltaproteobacteria bacterium]
MTRLQDIAQQSAEDGESTGMQWLGRRVLMVTSSYPAGASDFRARFVHEMAVALRRAGASCSIVTPRVPSSASHECLDGISIERFEYPGWRSSAVTGPMGILDQLRRRPDGLFMVPGFLKQMTRALRRKSDAFAPDLVVAHWLVPSGLALRSAGLDVPSAALAHSSDVHLLATLGPVGRRIARWIETNMPVFATSKFLAQTLEREGLSRNPIILPLGVRLPARTHHQVRIEPSSHSSATGAQSCVRPPSPRAKAVCAMGRFIPIKGFELLLEAVSKVPHLTLTIAGDGPLRSRFEQRARRLGLTARVEIRPPVLEGEKPSFFARHDIFAFTGISRGRFVDNLPVSVLEAMAHGCAIVSTRVGAMPELLASGAGVLANCDATSLAIALSKACQHVATMSQRAREEAERRSWSQVSRRLWDLAGNNACAHRSLDFELTNLRVPSQPTPGRAEIVAEQHHGGSRGEQILVNEVGCRLGR